MSEHYEVVCRTESCHLSQIHFRASGVTVDSAPCFTVEKLYPYTDFPVGFQ